VVDLNRIPIVGIVFSVSTALFFALLLTANRPDESGLTTLEKSGGTVVLLRALATAALVSGLWWLTSFM